MSKSKLRKIFFLSLVFFLVIFTFINMRFISGKRHKTRVEIVENEFIPDSFHNINIAYFSDVLSNFENLDKNIESIKNKNVDLILFGGNLLNEDIDPTTKEELIEKLKSLDAPLGKYAVLGEKDLEFQSYDILEQSDFRQLTMSGSKIYNFQNDFINLVGLETDELSHEDKNGAFEILLVNDAKTIETIPENTFDLILSGKYLGGQYKLPFLEPFGDHGKFFKKRYDLDQGTIILSQGLGTYTTNMRLNTNAETVIIILRNTNYES